MEVNLSSKLTVSGVKWSSWFSILCYHLWLSRNSRVFQGKDMNAATIISKTRAWLSWGRNNIEQQIDPRFSSYSWRPPDQGCTKMNTDGACNPKLGMIACGGILRDYRGEVKGGFMFNIGHGVSFEAEMWGIIMGLRLAWDFGASRLVLETDCLEAVETLEDLQQHNMETSSISKEIQAMLMRDWEVQIVWERREANKLAHMLAHRALDIGAGVRFNGTLDFIAGVVDRDKLLIVEQ